jgi:hypothetical protein
VVVLKLRVRLPIVADDVVRRNCKDHWVSDHWVRAESRSDLPTPAGSVTSFVRGRGDPVKRAPNLDSWVGSWKNLDNLWKRIQEQDT